MDSSLRRKGRNRHQTLMPKDVSPCLDGRYGHYDKKENSFKVPLSIPDNFNITNIKVIQDGKTICTPSFDANKGQLSIPWASNSGVRPQLC